MAAKDVETTVAHTATVHDYWMGGNDHFTASWEAAKELLRASGQRLPQRIEAEAHGVSVEGGVLHAPAMEPAGRTDAD